MDEKQKKEAKFSDYLYILYKWRKFLIINMIIVIAIATIIAFLIPKQYKATATIMIPQSSNQGIGGLSGLIGGNSPIASIGAGLLGLSGTSEDILLGILNSRTSLTSAINKFNLMKYYELDDKNMDKALKAFSDDVSFDPNEYGMIDISVVNKSPERSAKIANYFVEIVDSLNIKLNIEQAKNNRIFVEKRYKQNVKDLKSAEDSLYKFQKKYGIVAVPEQIEVSIKAAAEIEAQLIQKQIAAEVVKERFGENSLQYKTLLNEVSLLRDKVNEMKRSSNLTSVSNILFPFKELPDISIKYLRYFRELEIQQKIMEVILPLYEQAKVEEQKSIPTIQVLDKAVPPELKYKPKKSVIILGVFFLSLFIFIPFIFVGEKSLSIEEGDKNPLQIKEAKFFKKIIKIYRIKSYH